MSRTKSSDKKRAKNRTLAPLTVSLDKNLHAYVTAACAAGVSMLACATPAAAKIVYTPANTYILPNSVQNLDLDHNGKPDFVFSNPFFNSSDVVLGSLKTTPNSANAVWGTGTSASALAGGVKVGPNKRFQQGHNKMVKIEGSCTSVCQFGSHGPWADVTQRYLGLKFSIKGKLHYGWARLSVTVNLKGIYAVLTGYAYETVPNKPIVTGQTKNDSADIGGVTQTAPASFRPTKQPAASLGLLARGATGLDIWRKRQTVTN
jgi:hypothetical protein